MDRKQFSLSPEARRKHIAIFGKSGVGKTILMRNMIACDLYGGVGVIVIDPYGSLIEDVLEIIPRERTNHVIYIQPERHRAGSRYQHPRIGAPGAAGAHGL